MLLDTHPVILQVFTQLELTLYRLFVDCMANAISINSIVILSFTEWIVSDGVHPEQKAYRKIENNLSL